jgi:zinc/manganese transport system substrate-binding protein
MIALLFLLISGTGFAQDVVCTLPWLGDLTARLAPEARITVLARGGEDPHYLSPTPALMAKVGQADLYVEVGLNLEMWSARLLDGAGNPGIRSGQPGYVLASEGVPRLEVPTVISRAQGDMHPEGNPHIWLDPLNAPIVADNIAAGLGRIDPDNAVAYKERAAGFRQQVYGRLFGADLIEFMGGDLLDRLARSGKLHAFLESKGLDDRLGGWMAAASGLRGQPIVFYHQSWAYFVERFGLNVVGYVEDRPGISPSAAHRDRLVASMTAADVRRVGITVYYDDRLARVVASETGASAVTLPGDVGATSDAADWFALIDVLIRDMGL